MVVVVVVVVVVVDEVGGVGTWWRGGEGVRRGQQSTPVCDGRTRAQVGSNSGPGALGRVQPYGTPHLVALGSGGHVECKSLAPEDAGCHIVHGRLNLAHHVIAVLVHHLQAHMNGLVCVGRGKGRAKAGL